MKTNEILGWKYRAVAVSHRESFQRQAQNLQEELRKAKATTAELEVAVDADVPHASDTPWIRGWRNLYRW